MSPRSIRLLFMPMKRLLLTDCAAAAARAVLYRALRRSAPYDKPDRREIAVEVLGDLSYFNHAFRCHYGATPSMSDGGAAGGSGLPCVRSVSVPAVSLDSYRATPQFSKTASMSHCSFG